MLKARKIDPAPDCKTKAPTYVIEVSWEALYLISSSLVLDVESLKRDLVSAVSLWSTRDGVGCSPPDMKLEMDTMFHNHMAGERMHQALKRLLDDEVQSVELASIYLKEDGTEEA